MAHILIMPRQGNTVESCIIVGWKKNEGDAVQADTPVCEVETDKATFEVSAGADGTILKIIYQEGDDVPVLQPIAVIGNAGEDWQAALGSAAPLAAAEKTPEAEKSTPAPVQSAPSAAAQTEQPTAFTSAVATPAENGFIAISPRARERAWEEAVDITSVRGTGPGGRIIEANITALSQSHAPLTAAAKEALRAKGAGGVIPATGSGIGGRITREDLAAITSASARAENAPQAPTQTFGGIEYEDTPIKGIRKVIGDKMCKSLATTAQFTLNASSDARRLQELRKRFKDGADTFGTGGITINDLILFAASRMLIKHPYMNAHKLESTLRTFNTVHLGVAVDTPRGLMVPVIRNAQMLTLAQISAQSKALSGACIDGNIKPEQLSGSTLTVSNLGNTGIESFTPVINIPEVAILGVCGIQPKPVQKTDGGYEFVPHISFSLTIDHSVVDGSPAAKFLQAFCQAVKNIDMLLAQ